MSFPALGPRYRSSHAVVIGINRYRAASQLRYAVSDATAVADLLKNTFSFPESNIHLLTDAEATRSALMRCYLSLTHAGTDVDDRVVVFFAGHGHTVSGKRGETGYLVPEDGDPADLSTLIRWDELTRSADLIAAKHVLFLMDACYGGLALTRALKAGSMRFLKDMLLRNARQVLTAGKADEVVADSGGPLPNHSVFTGHLLRGLMGEAATKDGLMTANGLMAYTYQMVGQDQYSKQTPHYGYFEGDGDLIFSAPQLDQLAKDDSVDNDLLVPVPALIVDDALMTVVEEAKQLVTEERHRIALHDLVARETRNVISRTSEEEFALRGQWSLEESLERLQKYEAATADLRPVQALLGHWASAVHRETLTLALRRLSGRLGAASGLSVWIDLRWYPVVLLLYSAGIAAVAGARYDNLRRLLEATVEDPRSAREIGLVRAMTNGVDSSLRDLFKRVPGHERQYVPESEYLYKLLQPMLDDLLFLGTDYDRYFDEFEVLMSLVHADQYSKEESGRIWGPIGRFGWKARRRTSGSPLHRIISEAEAQGPAWPPLQSGLFGGSLDRFKEVSEELRTGVERLGWL